ncbi:hypothetical protein EDD21DRAFT_375010 [Dissophora ornata]|nr:hypothetical protein EDD21DRAFT_375010 [Dissophora ornata]
MDIYWQAIFWCVMSIQELRARPFYLFTRVFRVCSDPVLTDSSWRNCGNIIAHHSLKWPWLLKCVNGMPCAPTSLSRRTQVGDLSLDNG